MEAAAVVVLVEEGDVAGAKLAAHTTGGAHATRRTTERTEMPTAGVPSTRGARTANGGTHVPAGAGMPTATAPAPMTFCKSGPAGHRQRQTKRQDQSGKSKACHRKNALISAIRSTSCCERCFRMGLASATSRYSVSRTSIPAAL